MITVKVKRRLMFTRVHQVQFLRRYYRSFPEITPNTHLNYIKYSYTILCPTTVLGPLTILWLTTASGLTIVLDLTTTLDLTTAIGPTTTLGPTTAFCPTTALCPTTAFCPTNALAQQPHSAHNRIFPTTAFCPTNALFQQPHLAQQPQLAKCLSRPSSTDHLRHGKDGRISTWSVADVHMDRNSFLQSKLVSGFVECEDRIVCRSVLPQTIDRQRQLLHEPSANARRELVTLGNSFTTTTSIATSTTTTKNLINVVTKINIIFIFRGVVRSLVVSKRVCQGRGQELKSLPGHVFV